MYRSCEGGRFRVCISRAGVSGRERRLALSHLLHRPIAASELHRRVHATVRQYYGKEGSRLEYGFLRPNRVGFGLEKP